MDCQWQTEVSASAFAFAVAVAPRQARCRETTCRDKAVAEEDAVVDAQGYNTAVDVGVELDGAAVEAGMQRTWDREAMGSSNHHSWPVLGVAASLTLQVARGLMEGWRRQC